MSPLVAELLLLGNDDYVYLAELPYYAERLLGVRGEEEHRRAVIAVVRELLEKELWRVGELHAEGFREWECSTDASMVRIEAEWRALGRPLTLGDVCWFSNTPQADVLVQQLLHAGYKSIMSDD